MSLFNRGDNRNEKTGELAPPETAQAKTPAIEQPAKPPAEAAAPAAKSIPTPTKTGVSMASVISKALKITGELESTEDIQIDGQIEGDVRGVGVKIGQNAKVKGTVYGDEVELAGTVEGKIESKKVILTGTARMTGDIWHQDIKIESGAYISGTLKPELGKVEGRADVKASVRPASASMGSPANKDTPASAAAGHH
jgi:cytoskeletal protein CcmA (bactofilin family)